MDQDSKNFFEELAGSDSNKSKTLKITEDDKEGAEEKKDVIEETKLDSDIFEEDEGQLTIDVYQSPNDIMIESTIAGVKPEDLDISITNESVTIRGKREKEKTVKDEDYFYQECYWGKFSRSIILPQEIDSEKSVASIKNGILIIKLPKLNRQKTKKLKVKFD
ncbi:Hsp20/alpha crystallin family protein [Patescibacteria group bacterium]|nr:Hsp20/alpha crystallin family protein [Patescibacteria group bacterium]